MNREIPIFFTIDDGYAPFLAVALNSAIKNCDPGRKYRAIVLHQDLSQKNIRIFDLCYFVLSVLSEKDKFEITEEKWFDFLKNVFAGYSKIITLTTEEKESAVFVMECIELLFLAYFESQEDSALAQNTYNVFKFIKSNERRITKAIR